MSKNKIRNTLFAISITIGVIGFLIGFYDETSSDMIFSNVLITVCAITSLLIDPILNKLYNEE